jgi:putative ABC transport system permease protein
MLFKNVFRTLQKQYIQLILLGVIIVLSSFMYTVMEYAIGGVMEPTENYFEEANQEDFAISMLDIILEEDVNYIISNCPVVAALPPANWPFTISGIKNIDSTCYYSILDKRVELIEDTYTGISLEVRESKDVYFSNDGESFRIRFLKDMDDINTSFFIAGSAPNTLSEIAVAETFAKMNDLSIGDIFTVKDKDYTISGFVLFPDYNLPMFGSDFILDNKTQTVGLLSDQEFENFEENVTFEIAGVFTGTMNDDLFEENVIDDYKNQDELDFISNIVLTINNTRSGAIYAELSGGRAYGILMSLLVASIGLMIVGIMVSRVLHSQRGPIGILKSMGYSNNQITKPYIIFIGILALPTIFLGYFIGLIAATPFKDIFMSFYLLPHVDIEQSITTFFVAVIVPFAFIMGLSFFVVRRLLNQKPVVLLNPEVTSSSNFITKRVVKYLKGFKITSKLKHLLLYRNIVKFTVFLIGMFYAAFLILFSFSMNGMFDRMVYDYYDNTYHEYIGYCDYIEPCEVSGTMEEVIELPSALLDDEDIVITGLDSSSVLHPLVNKKGDKITGDLDDGLVITESLRILKGFKVGDLVTLETGDKSVELEIISISYEYSGAKAYIEISELSELLTDTPDFYNVVYSETELNSDDYLVVLSTEDIIKQVDAMQEFFGTFISIMVIASIVIGGIIIYILTVMTIEDNFYNISLFKVIGFNDREINKMILGGYSLYGVIIFVICIPIAIASFYIMEIYLGQYYNMLMPLKFEWWHAVLSVVIYLIIFNAGAFAAKRKLTKVSLQEAMKMYQV